MENPANATPGPDNGTSPAASLAAIRLTGADARGFLQGQLTQDIERLTPATPELTGWTNAKGRLLCIASLLDWQEAIWLILPDVLQASIIKRLRMFVLRADVAIDAPPMQITDNHKAPDIDDLTYCIEKNNSLLFRFQGGADLCIQHAAGKVASTAEQWRTANILRGIPTVWPATSERFVPQMVNLDLLNAVSFSKGCYVGQEIVARTQNLGRIKRRMYGFSATTSVHAGDKLFLEGREAGQIVDAVNHEERTDLLAVVQIDQRQESFFLDAAGELPVESRELPYAIPFGQD